MVWVTHAVGFRFLDGWMDGQGYDERMKRWKERRFERLKKRRIEGWKEGIMDSDKDGMIKRGKMEWGKEVSSKFGYLIRASSSMGLFSEEE